MSLADTPEYTLLKTYTHKEACSATRSYVCGCLDHVAAWGGSLDMGQRLRASRGGGSANLFV